MGDFKWLSEAGKKIIQPFFVFLVRTNEFVWCFPTIFLIFKKENIYVFFRIVCDHGVV